MGHFFNDKGAWTADDDGPVLGKSIHDAVWSPVGSSNTNGLSLSGVAGSDKDLTPVQCYAYSIPVYAAVNAIARNASKAKIRLFSRSGDEEILGGPAYELLQKPAPYLSSSAFLHYWFSWINILGEFNALKKLDERGYPKSMFPLDARRLQIEQPTRPPETPEDVSTWKYWWPSGRSQEIPANRLVHEAFFNPEDCVRGLSPMLVGGPLVTTGHHALAYNKSFFENFAIPSHIVVMPEGVPKQQRDDFERKYLSMYQGYKNSHKAFVAYGSKDIKVEQLEQPFQDGQFMDMLRWAVMQVGMLLKVPAIEMGIYDKTRFDTAAEERKLFVESTLMPQMQMVGESLQMQVVDPHFAFSATSTRRKAKFTKAMDEQYEQAKTDRPGSEIIVLLDADALPIMNSVNLMKVEQAKGLIENLHYSAKEAIDYVGLDGPERKEREDVWIDSKLVNITHPEFNHKLQPKPEPAAKPSGGAKPKPKPKELTAAQKAQVKSAEKFIRKLRKLTMEHVERGFLWGLDEADELASGDESCKRGTRILRHKLREIFRQFSIVDGRRDEVKYLFNQAQKNPQSFLGL
jgi:HK97 family phage portal protein